jgi:hypothetical protein
VNEQGGGVVPGNGGAPASGRVSPCLLLPASPYLWAGEPLPPPASEPLPPLGRRAPASSGPASPCLLLLGSPYLLLPASPCLLRRESPCLWPAGELGDREGSETSGGWEMVQMD